MDPKGNAFKYDYDAKHRVTGAASAAGMKYTFAYDNYGNPVTARTVDSSAETDAKKAMTSKAAYTTGTAEGQYMASQTSPEGVTNGICLGCDKRPFKECQCVRPSGGLQL